MKTNLKLSRELKQKIKSDMVITMETPIETIRYSGYRIALPTNTIINGELNFSIYEKHLYKECFDWYFKYNNKVDIGRYVGIYPLSLDDNNNVVRFCIDYFKSESWKDWFIDEDLQ
jgi:hypothetical protein